MCTAEALVRNAFWCFVDDKILHRKRRTAVCHVYVLPVILCPGRRRVRCLPPSSTTKLRTCVLVLVSHTISHRTYFFGTRQVRVFFLFSLEFVNFTEFYIAVRASVISHGKQAAPRVHSGDPLASPLHCYYCCVCVGPLVMWLFISCSCCTHFNVGIIIYTRRKSFFGLSSFEYAYCTSTRTKSRPTTTTTTLLLLSYSQY